MGVLRGELLRKLRLAAGLTQPQLAVLADISVRALRDMEQGRVTRPHPGSLQRLAAALDLDETERLSLLGRSSAARQDLVMPTRQRVVSPQDVVYVEPGDRQRYAGREEIFELSGGQEPSPMSMTWHHLVFDQARQLGCGEYTFRGRRQYHGLVIMQIRDGRVSRWREYQYPSESDWADFVGDSHFAS